MQLASLVVLLGFAQVSSPPTPWQNLGPGLALARLKTANASEYGDSRITILRVDPTLWELTVVGLSQTGEAQRLTAKEWSQRYDLAAAINAGMFAADYRTHTGYLRSRGHVNNAAVNGYQSVAAFDSKRPEQPPFRIFDLDAPGVTMHTILENYSSAVQNLRLVKRPGEIRWARQDRKWSEAVLGEDEVGRVLLIFTRSPYRMDDLCRELLSFDIGLVAAQHLEGGPEAQLYVRVGGTEHEWFGSFETSFSENDENDQAWPIPNVIGIRPRSR